MGSEEQDNLDLELVAELELSRLMRQFRIMEGDRNAFTSDAAGNLQVQRRCIQALKKEQADILADLTVATSDRKKKEDLALNRHLESLLTEYDDIENNVKTEKSHLNELDYQIKKMEKEVALIKTKAMTDSKCQERILRGQKRLGNFENRLEIAVKKFNSIVAENYDLRQEIDHLLKERAHFNFLWEKLIGCLNQGKKYMLDLIEQATIAYDQREEWCSKLQALKQRGQQDLVTHTQTIRQLQRRLDHDSKLQEFLGVKGQRRLMTDLENREAKKRAQVEERLREQLAMYRETLSQIQEFCKETDIERLAAQYIKQEEENFALFNYVNELNHESECLSMAIEDLKKKIDEQKELHSKREEQQQDNLAVLENKLTEEKNIMKTTETKLTNFNKNLSTVLDGIGGVFKLLKCNNAPLLELLGANSEVNAYNVLLHLGLIEQSVMNLIQNTYYKEKTSTDKGKKGKVPATPIIKPDSKTRYRHNPIQLLVPTQPCPLCVEQEQVSDVIDSLQCAKDETEVISALNARLQLPHALDRLHNVSACHLPQSRKIIQQRYQQ